MPHKRIGSRKGVAVRPATRAVTSKVEEPKGAERTASVGLNADLQVGLPPQGVENES